MVAWFILITMVTKAIYMDINMMPFYLDAENMATTWATISSMIIDTHKPYYGYIGTINFLYDVHIHFGGDDICS